MRSYLLIAFLISSVAGFSQDLKNLDLKNVLVVGQLDKPEDRYTLEINLSEMFANQGIKTMASLNVLKQGADPRILATDSIRTLLQGQGIDTYVLVSVRGYDRKFKPASKHYDLGTELTNGHAFPLYREEIVSITLEFNFYRNGEFVGYDILKLGGIGSRDSVLKKLRKKLPKRINKRWK
jgi:hypothetical protein